RGVRVGAPFGPGAVVDGDVATAEDVKGKREHRCGDAGAAARDHGPRGIVPGLGEGVAQLGLGTQRSVPTVQLVVREIQAAGDVTTAKSRPRLGLGPREAPK